MKKIIFISLSIPLFLFGKFDINAWDDKDKPFFQQRDNLSHFVINGVISGSTTLYLKERGYSNEESVFFGILVGMVFGIVKENMYDKNYSISDMQSWGIGAVLGSISVSFSFD